MADVEDLQRNLALAKAGLVAPEGARARVRARIAQSASVLAEGVSAERASAEATAVGRPMLSKIVRARAWTLGLMGLSFVAGYWLRGVPAGTEPPPTEPPSETVAASVQRDGVARSEAPSVLEHSAQAQAASAQAQAAVRGEEDAEREPQPRSRRRAAPSSNGAGRPGASRPAAPDGLAGEVALLQRVERAIRAKEGELALALLGKHEHDYPASSLREERAAARVLASCVARPGSEANVGATANARRYLAGRELSVYADRIRTLCVLDRDVKPEDALSGGH
ncbi:MAG: hypothetical protein RL033_6805 [Pseudomonadota bacterium]